MTSTYDAIVIGAGPAGSSAAILLARAGRSVALLEARPFPRRKVCGECIAASNLPLLEALGLRDALRLRAGPPLRQVALWIGEECITAPLPACEGGSPWGYALAREQLDQLLLEQARAAGVSVLQPFRVLGVQERERGAWREVDAVSGTVRLGLHAPVVIRAHGSWEPLLTERTAGGREHQPSDLLGVKASFRNATLPEGLLPVLGFTGGYGGMVLAGEGLVTLACCIRRDRLIDCRRSAPGTAAGERVEELLRRECAGVRQALTHASRTGPWLAAGPLRPGSRICGSAADGSFTVGNAAGEVHPIIGEGISMALQSSWLLCEQLAHCARAFQADLGGERGRREIGARYAQLWRARFRGRMRFAALLANAAMRPGMAAPLLPLLRHAPGLLGLAARVSGKTRCAVRLPDATHSAITLGLPS
jgi:flavin-dependent dehydrogenase